MVHLPSRTLLVALLAFAGAVASLAVVGADWRAMAATLPDVRAGSDERSLASLDGFDATGRLWRDAMVEPNVELLEHQLDLAVPQFGAGGRAMDGLPRSLRTLSFRPQVDRMAEALDGVPVAELEAATFVQPPERAFDPWVVDVVVDVRAIRGNAPGYRSPSSTLRLVLRPHGDARRTLVDRWFVEQARFTPGGLFAMEDVTYVRRGAVAVAAPQRSAGLAREVADGMAEMLPGLHRRYPGLAWSDVAFVALVPDRATASLVYPWDGTEMDGAVGYAKGTRHIALLLPTFANLDRLGRRDIMRHELTHLATGKLTATGWRSWVEGLAEWEGNHEIVADDRYFIINGPSVDLVEDGTVDVERFLFQRDGFDQLDDPYDGYRLGMLVADYVHERYGRPRALRLYRAIAGGTHPRSAVQRVLGTSPKAFERGVVAWMSAHRTWE